MLFAEFLPILPNKNLSASLVKGEFFNWSLLKITIFLSPKKNLFFQSLKKTKFFLENSKNL